MDGMTERELLATICHFISTRQMIVGDKDSIKDMAQRYKSPPISMAYPACLRLTMQDTYTLNDLLKQAHTLLASTEVTPLMTPIAKAHLENTDSD